MVPDDQRPIPSRELNRIFEHNVRILSRDRVNGRLVAAARALLGLDQIQFAEKAGIRRQTLADLEGGARRPQARIRDAVLTSLDESGVVFIEAGGRVGPMIDPGLIDKS